jgi:pSer/pThr/pTyr-binding forkhead associated (FHA) protein
MVDGLEIVVREPGCPDRVQRLSEGVATVGRAEDCAVLLADAAISRRHARIVVRRDGAEIEDLGSGNGIYYRGSRVPSVAIESDDEVSLGPYTLLFRLIRSDRLSPAGFVASHGLGAPQARLEVVKGDGLSQAVYAADAHGLTIGRGEDQDIILSNATSSRRHARLRYAAGNWRILDEGSANGVFVNGARVLDAAVRDGDRIRIGDAEFRFMAGDPTTTDSKTQRALPGDWGKSESQPLVRADTAGRAAMTEETGEAPAKPAATFRRVVAWSAGAAASVAALAVLAGVLAGLAWLSVPNHSRGPAVPRFRLSAPMEVSAETLAGDALTEAAHRLRLRDGLGAMALSHEALRRSPGQDAAQRLAVAAAEQVVVSFLENRQGDLRPSDPPPQTLDGSADLPAAQRRASELRWDSAVWIYERVLATSTRPDERRLAQQGLAQARAQLARDISSEWRNGHLALDHGDATEAIQHFENVAAMNASHPSARLWLKKLPK